MKQSKKNARRLQKRQEKFDDLMSSPRIPQTWKSAAHRPGSIKK